MNSHRKTTRTIHVGGVPIGGDSPVVVQSMTNTDTRDIASTVDQIARLTGAGCEIVRLAVPDLEAASAFKSIKQKVDCPLIADIHFDHRLAIAALENGADALRINPGNIGGREAVKKIVYSAREHAAPIRVGVNSGSLQREVLRKYGRPTPEALVESALKYTELLEELGFDMLKVSLKSSNVLDTVAAYELFSRKSDYPLHLGITEAGTLLSGTVKSAIGIGFLLHKGIGDTLRVSLTGDPTDEIKVAYDILRTLDIRHRGPEIISCPTCGRCEIDLPALVKRVEDELGGMEEAPKVAIMGCVVNGPGEAREADIGIAGGRGQGILFKKGRVIKKIPEERLSRVLVDEVRRLVE